MKWPKLFPMLYYVLYFSASTSAQKNSQVSDKWSCEDPVGDKNDSSGSDEPPARRQ